MCFPLQLPLLPLAVLLNSIVYVDTLHCPPILVAGFMANTVTACCAVLKHSQCAALQCCQCCHVPSCCHWLIVALTLFLLSSIMAAVTSQCTAQQCCWQWCSLSPPLLHLASCHSLACVAVGATACCTAPLYCQCWCTSTFATVVPWLLSLLASFCCSGTNLWSLAFLHVLFLLLFLQATVTVAGLHHSVGNADGIFAVTACWLLLYIAHNSHSCHCLLHCDASWCSLHYCCLSLLAACYWLFACCIMLMSIDTQCELMLTVPHHSRWGLSHHFIWSLPLLYLYSCDWE